MIRTILICAALFGFAPWAQAQGQKAAIFGFKLLDTSNEGEIDGVRADQTQRIELLRTRLVEVFREKGYTIVPVDPVAGELDKITNIAHCNGCDGVLAARLGADVAVTGEVQKVSNLILTINVIIRQAGEGDKVLKVGNADIRGNTDDSWLRGLNYILKNQIFKN